MQHLGHLPVDQRFVKLLHPLHVDSVLACKGSNQLDKNDDKMGAWVEGSHPLKISFDLL